MINNENVEGIIFRENPIDGHCKDCWYRRSESQETPCVDCMDNPVKIKPNATYCYRKWEGFV